MPNKKTKTQTFYIKAPNKSKVKVIFKENYYSGSNIHHFEFYGNSISPTGYHSNFTDDLCGYSFKEYAQKMVNELYQEYLSDPARQQKLL